MILSDGMVVRGSLGVNAAASRHRRTHALKSRTEPLKFLLSQGEKVKVSKCSFFCHARDGGLGMD